MLYWQLNKQVDMNLGEVKGRMHAEIVTHEYVFDRKAREIKMLEDIINDPMQLSECKQDIIKHFYTLFVENPRRLTLEMVSGKHKDEQEADFKINSEDYPVPRVPVKLIDHKT
jgi:hypothetical protein